jgi:hypothetical protein
VEGARLVRRGVSFSLAQPFDMNGPQTGWRRRTNPVHTMLDTGLDAARGTQGFPHGFGGADDVVFMPLQCSTQWDGLGHIFDHGQAWNGRNAADVVTSEGDQVTGIEKAASLIAGRAVLLDAGRALGHGGELPDGFAITPDHLENVIAARGRVRWPRATSSWSGPPAGPGPPGGWGGLRRRPRPRPLVHLRPVVAPHRDRRDRYRHVGLRGTSQRVRSRVPAAAPGGHPAHRLYIGEMWDTEALATDCAADGRYEFWLTAAPIPVTGAVGAPVNPIAVK